MKIYWRERKSGQELILESEAGDISRLGAVRKTSRGFDALATTFGYQPERAVKGLSTLEDGKEFVISFEPWNQFEDGIQGLPIESQVHPAEQ